MIVVTWNMQGANYATENKWNVLVPQLLGLADVVCLQEAGAVPATAVYLGKLGLADLYAWGGTSTRPRWWITFYPWDQNGNRCNLAVVTWVQPAAANVVWPAVAPTWRPALGVVLAAGQVYSLHAISPGGPDVVGLLNAVNTAAAGAAWVAAGDFNREPGSFVAFSPNPPNVPTHNATAAAATHSYDYCVTPVAGSAGNTLFAQMSDHFPVRFDL